MKSENKICAILSTVTRNEKLSPLINQRPVATLPFDCKYRLIDFPLSSLANAHVNSIFMTANQGETQSIFDHMGSGSEWGLDSFKKRYFVYIQQDFERLKEQGLPYFDQQISFLRKSKAAYTVLLDSKFVCNVDLTAVLKIHKASDKHITAIYKKVTPDMAEEFDTIIRFDENNKASSSFLGQLTSVREKEALSLNMFIVDTEWLIKFLQRMQEEGEYASSSRLLRKYMVDMDINTYEYTGYMSNIRTIKSYYDANMSMLDSSNFTALLYSSQPVRTKVNNEVPTYFSKESNVTNSQLSSGCIVEGNVKDSLISRRSKIEKNASVENTMMFTDSKIKSGAQVKYAIVDKHVVIENDVRVEGTLENPVVIPKNTIVTENIIQK
ncbi:glucose-1-phosphate adenylyltransferase subunit GlgD [Lactococcus garvieae]|uniref:glucose-1-phosphate adenylyltransferase subunit GlgD n=1 Tax=Lactococcus garvieae TaxID=1363 RepID=UPI0009BCB537|nr:glucose-1-phosphate adenylyltransferase subunit GlgD [Lactococcus garvieae]